MQKKYPDDEDRLLIISKGVMFAGLAVGLLLLAYLIIHAMHAQPVQQGLLIPETFPVTQESTPQVPPPETGGTTGDVQELKLGFRVSGRITQMFFTDHTPVKEGEVLAALDPAPFERTLAVALAHLQTVIAESQSSANLPIAYFNAIEAARADVEKAQHVYDVAHEEWVKRGKLQVAGELDNVYNDDIQNEHDAKLDLEKMQRMLKQRQDEADNSPERIAQKVAVQIARKNVALAEAAINETRLIAPASGMITGRTADIGTPVATGETVYLLSVPKSAPASP